MKKLLLVAGLAFFGLTAQAQEQSKGLQGAWFATSQFGYQQTKSGDVKSTNLMVLPIVGTFVTPTVAVGAGIGYLNVKADNVDVGGSPVDLNSKLYVIQPLARKYWNVAGNFYFFGQVATPIITGKEETTNLKINQFGATMSGGFDFFVTKNFSVEFSYNLVNFSQTTLKYDGGGKTTVTDFSIAHVANVESAYNNALYGSGGSLTTPLSFGFKFVF
ncbi:outer membrane beta-barrel protein [Flavobacterium sp. IMCC34852]|uniref:Outer membrane beta-barrel protein n=1 Tax=Flavobacterium rivulicola TaxID=2732161 RepID=A0A7Y3VZM6_9FLAO|nr:outer membrane beta-barrel protein [Flavobacterium sp. IMCC34852]NNT72930.1 outer membrane beta-barrel protein [Flavobacterium sp. IMCC34852]